MLPLERNPRHVIQTEGNRRVRRSLPPNATDCRLLNPTRQIQIPHYLPDTLLSRSHKVSCLRSASSMNSEGVALVPFDTAAAAHDFANCGRAVDLFLHFECPSAAIRRALEGIVGLKHHSAQKILLRQKSSGLPSPSTSNEVHPRLLNAPPGRRNIDLLKVFTGHCRSTFTFSYGTNTTKSVNPSWSNI